eukprot:evm.model.scf_1256.3 EVM.evm.TU.scf_1256.3   scf_1256:30246-44664(-)
MQVRGGDEINIMGTNQYSYIFQRCESPVSTAMAPVPPAAVQVAGTAVGTPVANARLCDGELDGPVGLPLSAAAPDVNLVDGRDAAAVSLDPECADVSQTDGLPQPGLAGLLVGEREGTEVDDDPQPHVGTPHQMLAPSTISPSSPHLLVGHRVVLKPNQRPLYPKASRVAGDVQRRSQAAQEDQPVKEEGQAAVGVEAPSGEACMVKEPTFLKPLQSVTSPGELGDGGAPDHVPVAARDRKGEPPPLGGPPQKWPSEDAKAGRLLEGLREDFHQMVVDPDNLGMSFDDLPYPIGKGLKDRLLYTAFLHVKRQVYTSFVSELPSMSPRILLSGPYGSSRCQEAIVRALAHEVGSKVVAYDRALLGLECEPWDETGEEAGGAGAADDADDIDFLDDLDGKTLGGSSSEALSVRHHPAAGGNSSVGHRKRIRGGMGGYATSTAPIGHAGTKEKGKGKSSLKIFKKGDRVVYTGAGSHAQPLGVGLRSGSSHSAHLVGFSQSVQGYLCNPGIISRSGRDHGATNTNRGPWYGCPGKVVLVWKENPKKVGVCFDYVVPGGIDLGRLCEEGHGFFCSPQDLKLEGSGRAQEQEALVIDALFDVVGELSTKGPVTLMLKDVEKSVAGSSERCSHFKRRLDALRGPVLVVGLHTADARRDRPQGGLFSRLGPSPGALLELGFLDSLRWEDKAIQRSESSKTMKLLSRLLPNRCTLHAPSTEGALAGWKKLIEHDVNLMREDSNRQKIAAILSRCTVECPELDLVVIRDTSLRQDNAERLVGLAVAHSLKKNEEPELQGGRLVLRAEDFQAAAEVYRNLQTEMMPSRLGLKEVVTDNEYERRLLGEVVPPEEVGVGFDDIGALESVKRTLKEVVMLPLQRPELFARGQLLKPTKGVLLFGPPGTGKTMLAKAVAAESGANFINVSVATVASKWFGEGEKYVRALFSLAHKIAPSVIFIDEVDSLLGRRDKNGEHEAMRKIKNEFMAGWDGLKTKESDRVLVLAATNRPMDLDEAVIRRMPRRLLVDLPNRDNRVKILSVILREEELESRFSFDELATMTEGYSGSDLKNMCLAAAFQPVRDHLAKEKDGQVDGARDGKEAATADKSAGPSTSQQAADDAMEEAEERRAVESSGEDNRGMVAESSVPRGGEAGQATVLALKPSASGGARDDAVAEGRQPAVKLRSITMGDFRAAMKEVGSSVSADAINMTELRQWNEMYGEGGSRRETSLPYFL